jgi:hypothetical protein
MVIKNARTENLRRALRVGHGGHRPALRRMADTLSLLCLEAFLAVRSLIDGLD